MYPPTLPLLPFIVADLPLSGVADVLFLPADIAIDEQKVWYPDRDCGMNFH